MITIFRLGHRRERDKRITTHVALVARAFGGDGMVYSGEKDENFEESVKKVVENWGGKFFVKYEKNWKKFLTDFKGIRVHLTMYGINFQEKIPEIRKYLKNGEDILIIVGSEKVHGEVYALADYNLAIGNQPHSEVGALAIFLYELSERKIKEGFENWKIRVIPQERGKKTINKRKSY